ncbi:MarR family transcriptional regulator [Mucilaginibacter sp. MD40]|uniref:MarR family winged helix-turn-helix transcriptional regulator n=1 Tax=Mucilaginibacter sp. MD40 TaxID=2029590 RepID=UPI000BAC5BEF|nr:helix-turn-helix domain-containing protein [Mucilaginibacter sp. MD40]PAW92763.1 MarR family transcriptional regulator [Mucilaginibacter sp. MD40]
MNDDFLKKLGYKALDSRLKRISDRMSHDIRKLYKEIEIDIEPHWYLVFMLLENQHSVSISYIAEKLGYAHPSAVMIVKRMSDKEYLTITDDESDRRRQMVSLSAKARRSMPLFKNIWDSCEAAILQTMGTDLGIFIYLDKIDASIKKMPFYDRFKEEYLKNVKPI